MALSGVLLKFDTCLFDQRTENIIHTALLLTGVVWLLLRIRFSYAASRKFREALLEKEDGTNYVPPTAAAAKTPTQFDIIAHANRGSDYSPALVATGEAGAYSELREKSMSYVLSPDIFEAKITQTPIRQLEGEMRAQENTLVFPLYYKMKIMIGIVYICRSTFLIAFNPNTDIFTILMVSIFNPLEITVQCTLAFFLTQPSITKRALNKTAVFGVIWFAMQSCIGLIFYEYPNAFWKSRGLEYYAMDLTNWYWLFFDFQRLPFYATILFYLYTKRRERSAGRVYAWIFFLFYAIIFVADWIEFDISYSERSKVQICVIYVILEMAGIGFPYLVYRTFVHDSMYWHQIILQQQQAATDSIKAAQAARETTLGVVGSDDCSKKKKHAADFFIHFNHLSFDKALAEGGTADVWLGKCQGLNAGESLVIKLFKPHLLTSAYISRFSREMYLCSLLNHPYLVRCYGVCIMPPSVSLLYEYMEKGSLFHALKTTFPPISLALRTKLMCDAALGLAFLHSRSVLHRDVKSLNCLIDHNWKLKLADLGEARIFEKMDADEGSSADAATSLLTQDRGTPHWMAPELFQEDASSYDAKVDVYALGMTMFEVFAGRVPFSHLSIWLIPSAVVNNERPALPSNLPPELTVLIQACWHADAARRPTAYECVQQLRQILDTLLDDGARLPPGVAYPAFDAITSML